MLVSHSVPVLFWLKPSHTNRWWTLKKQVRPRGKTKNLNQPARCIPGARGWGGSTHLGTSWEPQQDLQGRRRNIYLELILIYICQSALHTRGGTNTATHTLRGRPLEAELLSCATLHFCRSTCVLGYQCWSPSACWPLTPDKIIYKQHGTPHNFLFMFMRFVMQPLNLYLKVHQIDAFNFKMF